jgi:murein DD-endopeptidase MepM/ murein hydrolase activator NlpD
MTKKFLKKTFDIEKKQNIANFNFIFLIILLSTISISSILNTKNIFNNTKNHLNKKYNFLDKSFLNNNIQLFNINKKQNLSLATQNDIDNLNFKKEIFKKNIYFLEENNFLNKNDIKNLLITLNNFKVLNNNFFNLDSLIIFNKTNENNLLKEIIIKLDDFRCLKISISNNEERFKIEKILAKNKIIDLANIEANNEYDYKDNVIINQNFNTYEIFENIGLDNKYKNNSEIILLEEEIENDIKLKFILNKLNIGANNIGSISTIINNKDIKNKKNNIKKIDIKDNASINKKIKFKAIVVKHNKKNIDKNNSFENKNNDLKKISYSTLNYNNISKISNSESENQLIYFSINDKKYYLFKNSKTNKYYYDENGNSLHSNRMFNIPINGKYRISSNFGMRFHPILKYTRMHTGVDLAIRHGHPVHAPANGYVEFAGRKGGYGNYIVINHGNSYKTAYGHLYKFDKKIKPGKFISQNQLIAYVGNTGTSSGPHLHYEMIIRNKFVNPLTNNLYIKDKLNKSDMNKFKKTIDMINKYSQNIQTETNKNFVI